MPSDSKYIIKPSPRLIRDLKHIRNNQIILILMAGSHENFYARLKQYLKNSSWVKYNQ